jgi:hypothetical protein
MTPRTLTILREQLAIAIARGDRAAELMLRARILSLSKPWTEAELRAAWGDR